MKVSKAKPKNNIVSPAKPMPSVHTPDSSQGDDRGLHGPGINVPKKPRDYSKKGK